MGDGWSEVVGGRRVGGVVGGGRWVGCGLVGGWVGGVCGAWWIMDGGWWVVGCVW